MARLASQEKAGFYPTPPRVVEAIVKILDPPYRGQIFMLDPCCGKGEALALLAKRLREKDNQLNFVTYGIELDQNRAKEAQNRLNVVEAGDAFSLVCQPRWAFSLVFLNPPYDVTADGKRLEYEFLKMVPRLLRENGVIIYIVPHYILKGDLARYWASWFYDTICLRFPDPEWEPFKQVVLIGLKRKNKLFSPDEREKEFLLKIYQNPNLVLETELGWKERSKWAVADPESPILENVWKNSLPDAEGPSLFFTGGLTEEMFRKFAQSGLREQVFDKLTATGFDGVFQPVMSLREGHLLQVLLSGGLNGKIRDQNGNEIFLKGTLRKTVVETVEEEQKEDPNNPDKSVSIRKTSHRDRFEFAVQYWTPDGKLREVKM